MIHLTNNPLICKCSKKLVISAPERFEFFLEISYLSKRTIAITISQYTLDLLSLTSRYKRKIRIGKICTNLSGRK